MATIGATYLDLIDVFKRSNSDDALQIATIIEMLKQTNPIMDDAITVEANLGTRHRTTLRTSLPSGAWGKLYQGIPASKSGTAQIEDTTGFYEALSSVDTRLLELSGGQENAIRLSEAKGFLEDISQKMTSAFFYANAALEPEKPTGLAPRFSSLSGETGGQIVNASGDSDRTSVWFVTWGTEQTHLIYPKGTKAGVDRQDKGEQRVLDGNGDPYFAKEELFRQHMGVVVRDYRYVARIANIDVAELAAGNVDIYKLMRQAFWKIKSHRVAGGRQAIYCNADVLEALDADSTPTTSTSDSFVRLRPTEVDGFEVMAYRGIPVRQCDAITNTETAVA